jgi:hypothetical protein
MKKEGLLLIPLALLVIGCSSYRPIVDENEHFRQVGSTRAEADIDNCLAQGDRYLETHKSDRLLKEAGRGAAGGAIIGGLVGVFTGSSKNALAGAAIGAGVGAASRASTELSKDNLNPDELKQRYVSNCLKRKKYAVIGWK